MKLARRMFTLIIVVSFAPLIFVTGLVIEQFQSAYEASVHQHLRNMVDKQAAGIDAFLSEKRNTLSFLSNMVDPATLKDPVYLQNVLQLLRQNYGAVYEDLSVIDESGRQTGYAGEFDLVNAEYAHADWFQKAWRHPVFSSDVFTGYRGYPHFVVTVKTTHGDSNYLLRATIRFETFTSIIENLRLGSTGSAFIINRHGRFQTQPDGQRAGRAKGFKSFSQNIPLADGSSNWQNAIQNYFEESLCMTATINNGEWLLIFLQEPSDALSALIRAQKTATVIFLLGGLCIILMAFYLPSRLLLHGTAKGAINSHDPV